MPSRASSNRSVLILGLALAACGAPPAPPVDSPTLDAQAVGGLTAQYWDNADFTGPTFTRTDATVNFSWGGGSPDARVAPDTFSARWTGSVLASATGTYTFATTSDDGVRLWVDGVKIIDNWTDHGPTTNTGAATLQAGRRYDIKVEYYEKGGGAVMKLEWTPPNGARTVIPASALSTDAAPTPPPTPTPAPTSADTVAYLGGAGAERLNGVLALSNGTFLAVGGADDLAWLPAGTPRTTLPASAITGQPGGRRAGFLLHLAGDMKTVLRAVALPAGATTDLRQVKTTSAPGQPTGDVFVSGLTATGYFIAKLDGNFVTTPPSGFAWVRNVAAGGDHRANPAWDVGSDGKVVFASGTPFAPDWAAVYRLRSDGRDDVVPDWRYHWGTSKATGARVEGGWTPAASRADVNVTQSAVVLKFNGRCDLRSWTTADYTAVVADGNGGTKRGKWPLDLLFSGPCNPASPTASGGGYTGYRPGSNPTLRAGAVTIDRRDNSIYLGLSVQSRLPNGNPDFEPAVVAYTNTGALKWWSRLYTETPQNSSPDQYVDGLAVDASSNTLVVLARSHGNNVYNLWKGAGTFHTSFTGTNGNIHVSWLGKLGLTDGAVRAASYVAEYVDGASGANFSQPYADPNLDGWASHNAGWPDLNTTRCRQDVAVDPSGRVYVLCTGRRTITTRSAHQKMPKPSEGVSTWNDFVRVFTPDLKTLTYSSLLTGAWNKATGAGGGNTTLQGVAPTASGVVIVGFANATGNAVPTVNVPAWASPLPSGESGLFAKLGF